MFTLALTIAGITTVLIGVVYIIQRRSLYRQYGPIEEDARQIATGLKADTFRDGDDLVIAGNFQSFPAIVRFSYNQNTPGLHIEMRAPATFDLLLSPKKVTTTRGRMAVRTGNSSLDSRFNARTDHPTQARMLFNDKSALSHLEKLCCSSNTDFTVKSGAMELNELSIPNFPARHVLDHLESLDVLAKVVAKMPGAHEIKLEPVKQERRTWMYPALAVVLLLSVVVAVFSRPASNAAYVQQTPHYVPAGMESLDAEHLLQLEGWRLAGPDDFSPTAAGFLQQRVLSPTGRYKADFLGRGNTADSVYLLVDDQGKRRVSMMAGGIAAYDALFDKLDAIGVVPKADLAGIQWTTDKPFESDGDGLLLVQDITNPASGLVLVLHSKQIDSARPLDFTRINLYSGQ
jgi:hypothetical protein